MSAHCKRTVPRRQSVGSDEKAIFRADAVCCPKRKKKAASPGRAASTHALRTLYHGLRKRNADVALCAGLRGVDTVRKEGEGAQRGAAATSAAAPGCAASRHRARLLSAAPPDFRDLSLVVSAERVARRLLRALSTRARCTLLCRGSMCVLRGPAASRRSAQPAPPHALTISEVRCATRDHDGAAQRNTMEQDALCLGAATRTNGGVRQSRRRCQSPFSLRNSPYLPVHLSPKLHEVYRHFCARWGPLGCP